MPHPWRGRMRFEEREGGTTRRGASDPVHLASAIIFVPIWAGKGALSHERQGPCLAHLKREYIVTRPDPQGPGILVPVTVIALAFRSFLPRIAIRRHGAAADRDSTGANAHLCRTKTTKLYL